MRLLSFALMLLVACHQLTEQGPVGAPGEPGPAGPRGEPGSPGPIGPRGEIFVVDGGVLVGPPGPAGSSVILSAAGSACPTGGVRVSLEDGGSAQVLCNGTVGAQGPQGAAGAAGAVGAAGPTGTNGAPGVSAVITSLPVGDMNCPNGGTRFTVGTAISYACTGAAGTVGPPGPVAYDGGLSMTPSADGFAFAGFTSQSFAGNLGGSVGAHAKCNAEFSGSHLCTDREYEWAGSATSVPATGAWIDQAYSGSSFTAFPRDHYTPGCNRWRDGTSTTSNIYVDIDGVAVGSTSGTLTGLCNSVRPLACCYGPHNWFRGFTTQSFNGNLGGQVGANAKCHAQFAGAHVCTDREYEWAGSATSVPAAGAWIDQAYSGSSFTAFPRDHYTPGCNRWRDGTSSTSNIYVDIDGVAVGSTSGTLTGLCNSVRPLACCGP